MPDTIPKCLVVSQSSDTLRVWSHLYPTLWVSNSHNLLDWRVGSLVRSTSSRPEFSSQHPQQVVQTPCNSSPRKSSSSPLSNCSVPYTHTDTMHIHINKNKSLEKTKKGRRARPHSVSQFFHLLISPQNLKCSHIPYPSTGQRPQSLTSSCPQTESLCLQALPKLPHLLRLSPEKASRL